MGVQEILNKTVIFNLQKSQCCFFLRIPMNGHPGHHTTQEHFKFAWPQVARQLFAGTFRSSVVRFEKYSVHGKYLYMYEIISFQPRHF